MSDVEHEGPGDETPSPAPGAGGSVAPTFPELGDLGELLAKAEAAAEQLEASADEAQSAVFRGSAAGGAVVIEVSGGFEPLSVHIDAALVDPSDIGMLEDAVLAALRDGLEQVLDQQSELAGRAAEADLSALLGSLGKLPMLGGLGLPDFGSLSSPEDLIAGLGGALGGVLSGALGGVSGTGPPALPGETMDAGDEAYDTDDSDDTDDSAGEES